MALEPVAPPAATLRLLGGASLLVDGEPRLARRFKTIALLGCLARAPGGRCRRAWLADLLWGDAGGERARHSLRQALADLRRHLGPVIRSTPEEAWIERDGLHVDVDDFDAAVDAGAWEAAVAAWRGEFLAGADGSGTAAFAAWLAGERAALGDRLALACAHLVADARDAGDADAALAHADRWAALLPADERGHRAVIELLAQTGRTGEAAI
ncbi:MAG TPA: BTAD domain-containing putative transcriptional regulator, partial [Gemmatimonadales bacterium]|nr:BTAD domain-containing putative transcriptional regulator [Gemmatimonadales bacterium]